MGRLVKKLSKGCYRGLQIIHCCGTRTRRPPSVHDAEKSVDLSSSAITRTSTTISPSQSPPAPSSPTTDLPPTSIASTQSPFGLVQATTQPSPSTQTPFSATEASQNTIVTKSALDRQVDNDTASDLDKIFEEAWQPDNDGSDLPWSKSISSPSAAARYLDDVEDGK